MRAQRSGGEKGKRNGVKNQPGLERSWGDREKDSRNQEQRRGRNRKGKGGQEFGFHLNHSSENGLAKFSKDFFVAKSDSSFSVLSSERTCLLL